MAGKAAQAGTNASIIWLIRMASWAIACCTPFVEYLDSLINGTAKTLVCKPLN